ncbi:MULTISPECIES: 2-amino-4-hydroxy-6-hydroxymethyldihydropteridine diphosphokinase [unclassified Mycobacterium]|uniref:2-amino-4-hydroxy-6- hydroxymethyldihydropteridine diphosphokinase n=1 Tax=unclassified Mycobacterium TaxID=2642494 RepID=UPI0027423659|nr:MULTISPECIES: 2-amino-4-hydroxy-6-hydroxymethyldihydropteridine diphosphokinase [unclassified Mycobacterium]MDP7706516.1 2-amino-4-hydroxy-6-hydroxymethyldihydropteridine diphosphokinase [Mycobacterium sp. TY815]MDP7725698.1 2-amino-4-hydroxy-6-hydroxymethyldihydropteridine diphosphokinase [Mycobacterium sp. TY814]
MTQVVLSIGSNMGDRLAHLQSVVDGLGDAVRAVSPVYETDPWGGVDQEPFLNAVLIAEDPARDPHDWLRRAHEIEQAAGRVREVRWGPRTLDVDLIACYGAHGQLTLDDPELTLPHPRAHLRAFVLVPWLDVDPAAELSRPVRELLTELDGDAVRPTALALDT